MLYDVCLLITGQEETEINDAGPKKKKKKAKIRFRDIVDMMKRRESQYSQYDEETSNVLNMLRIHFGDPFSRCLSEKNTVRKVPIKMILLLIKLILVTAQVNNSYTSSCYINTLRWSVYVPSIF